jgi:hypothetical protein
VDISPDMHWILPVFPPEFQFGYVEQSEQWGFPNHPKIDKETVDAKMPPKFSSHFLRPQHRLINNLHIILFTHHVIHGLTKVQKVCDKKRPYSLK